MKAVLLFLSIILFSGISQANSDKILVFSSIYDVKELKPEKEKTLLVFSSRYYIDDLRKISGDIKNIYWILPVAYIEQKDLDNYIETMSKANRKIVMDIKSDGINIKEEGWAEYNILPYTEIARIVSDKVDIILDVDFFFRLYLSTIAKVNNEKTLEIIKFYRSIEDYNLIPENLYLILSRDINLPSWVEEFGYITQKVYFFWKKKEFPDSYVLLDEVGKYIVFGNYEEAYEILLDVFPEHIENPYFYEKMLYVSSKLSAFNDMLKAFEEGYKLSSNIVSLVPEIAENLLNKGEIYPAYLLVKNAYEKEIWNKELKNLLDEIVRAGYNFYNKLHEDDELFKFFKEEYNKLRK